LTPRKPLQRLTVLVLLSAVSGCIPFVHREEWVLAINETTETHLLRMNTGVETGDHVVTIGPGQTAEAWSVEPSTVVVIELLAANCDVLGRVRTSGTGDEKVWIRSDGLHGPQPATGPELRAVDSFLSAVDVCERDLDERSSAGLP